MYINSHKIFISFQKCSPLFYYDSDGNVTSFKYNGTMYYYIKNLQGDVVKIINQSGAECVSYVYDAWGNTKSASGNPILRELNPFRYRSYVYDEETGLYYLQSRYYDPFTGRFLNADVYNDTGTSVIGTNKFVYCDNNSINYIDKNGDRTATISAIPKNNNEASIKNSQLNKKKDSVMDYYCGTKTSGGYEIYTYTKLVGTNYCLQSEYYALVKTEKQWKQYINNNWGGLKVTIKIINAVSELLTYCQDVRISAISTLTNILTNNYVPSQEKYICNQLKNNSNRRYDKYVVCMKVVNKKFEIKNNIITRKSTFRCFESRTYYPY